MEQNYKLKFLTCAYCLILTFYTVGCSENYQYSALDSGLKDVGIRYDISYLDQNNSRTIYTREMAVTVALNDAEYYQDRSDNKIAVELTPNGWLVTFRKPGFMGGGIKYIIDCETGKIIFRIFNP